MADFVIDASIAVAWGCLDEENTYAASILDSLQSGSEALAPSLWGYEIRHAMLRARRRERATSARVAQFLLSLEALTIELIHPPSYDRIFHLADRFNLTVYDAAYLDLALRRSLPLASLDRALCGAAARAAVPLFHT